MREKILFVCMSERFGMIQCFGIVLVVKNFQNIYLVFGWHFTIILFLLRKMTCFILIVVLTTQKWTHIA